MSFTAPPWAEQFAPDFSLVLASRNRHKVVEFGRMLSKTPWMVLSLDDVGFAGDVDEPYDTYEGNAVHKAEVVSRAVQRAVIADDSGIEIPALNDWPGHQSARWLGPAASDRDRLDALVARVNGRCDGDNRARYVAAVALAVPGVPTMLTRGETTGVIVEPRGQGGFGYDPAFQSDDLGKRFAEASDAEKDSVSHRGRALHALLTAYLGGSQ